MNENTARCLLLVRAIESEDPDETVLTREDREYATRAALDHATPEPRAHGAPAAEASPAADTPLTAKEQAFLGARAELAFQQLEHRFPQLKRACAIARWPRWLSWLLPIAAFLAGAAVNELSDGRQISIIAFPLLGMLLWNAAIYLYLLLNALAPAVGRRTGESFAHPLRGIVRRLMQPSEARLAGKDAVSRGLRRFSIDWFQYSAPLTDSRIARTLHLSAAFLAAGTVLGMYIRGIGLEYRAGWESTFVETALLHQMLHWVLGPASAVTGIALPGMAELEALRWSNHPAGGEAARWIHLYAATAMLFIVAPRLLLALRQAVTAARLRRNFPVPGVSDFYIRRLLAAAQGKGVTVRLIPYSFHPSERVLSNLKRLINAVLGERTEVQLERSVDYGGEDQYLDVLRAEPRHTDHAVVLFNLAATPESETHGTLVKGLQALVRQHDLAKDLLVVLDESALRQRFAGQAEAGARLASRLRAWEEVLRPHAATAIALDLETGNSTASIKQFEAALTPSIHLTGVR